MKKFLTILLIMVMCITLAACASGSSSGDDEDDYHYAAEDMEIGTGIGSFTSEDMDGNEVSDAVFAEKDVTIINVWATFCGPCIEEMPELAALAGELPDNAQVIGIIIDTPPAGADNDAVNLWGGASDNIDLARQICDETGVKYTNILASDSVMQVFENVEAVPTTFIVDREGNTICTPFIGADVDGYRKAVEDYLAGL